MVWSGLGWLGGCLGWFGGGFRAAWWWFMVVCRWLRVVWGGEGWSCGSLGWLGGDLWFRVVLSNLGGLVMVKCWFGDWFMVAWWWLREVWWWLRVVWC